MYRNGLVFRIIGALFLIGLIAAGGFMVYQAGIAQGVSQAPAVATAISQAAENGQAAPIPPMMYQYSNGYGPGYYSQMYGFHQFGFFPFGICGSIFFLFLFFGLIKMIFFRRMWFGHHGGHRHGPDGRPWGGPPWMRNYDSEENKEGEKKDDSPEGNK